LADARQPVVGTRLRVKPSPAHGTVTIEYQLARAGNCRLALYDLSGKLVRTLARGHAEAGMSACAIPRSDLSAGIYLLKFEADGQVATQKLIIE
jgi:hypothetical protein